MADARELDAASRPVSGHTTVQPPGPTLHGVIPKTADKYGEFYFGTVQFIRILEWMYARPGSPSFSTAPAWSEASFDRPFRLAAENLSNTIWKIDRVAELLDRARMDLQGFENFSVPIRLSLIPRAFSSAELTPVQRTSGAKSR